MKRVMTLAALMGAAATAAMAAGYPEKTVEIIVPYAAGGGTDLSVRVLADTMQKHLPGSTIVVRNETGGGGAIGTGKTLAAAADGYTVGVGAQGPIALLPHYGATTYTIDNVDFLGLMGRNPELVLACKDAPFDSFETFLEYAKANPGGALIGNTGAGGANHLATEAFARKAGITIEHVPFGGASEALTACAGGHINAVTVTPAEARAHIESGAAKPLFIMESERIAEMPDVPTAVEKGVDFTWSAWKGIIAPKGIPEDVRTQIVGAIKAAVEDPAYVAKMKEMGEFVDYRDPESYSQLAHDDSARAETLIRDLGMYGMNK